MAREYDLYASIFESYTTKMVHQLHSTPSQIAGELGLIGLSAYSALFIFLGWIFFCLSRKKLPKSDGLMMSGASLSLLGYGVSSLTDFQLESIPIAAILVFNLVVIASLATQYDSKSSLRSASINKLARQILSVLVLLVAGIAIHLWIVNGLTLYYEKIAFQASQAKNYSQAEVSLNQAASFSPWNPIPHIMAANYFYDLSQDENINGAQQQDLQYRAAKHCQQAAFISPNDGYFHYCSASLLSPADPELAVSHAEKTIQLLPRDNSYAYFQLGMVYLAQGEESQAIKAFALGMFANPWNVSLIEWEKNPALSAVAKKSASTAAMMFDEVLADLNPSSPLYKNVYEQRLLLRWWFNIPILDYNPKYLRIIIQALLLSDVAPSEALGILNTQIDSGDFNKSHMLLRAWLKPDIYLSEFFVYMNAKENSEYAETVRSSITHYRDIRNWLNSEGVATPRKVTRSPLEFVYRDPYARSLPGSTSPIAQNIHRSEIAINLDLFQLYSSRQSQEIDAFIAKYQAEELGLPHPSENNFSL
jgi:tetratricopeptide (TPR) repeat protein